MTQITQKALGFAKVAGRALHVAKKIIDEKQAAEKQAAEKVPGLLQRLKQAGLIDEGQVKQASAELGNHKLALDILNRVVSLYTAEKQASVKQASAGTTGKAVADTKAAPMDKHANYAGYRRGEGERSAADEALLRLIPGYRKP